MQTFPKRRQELYKDTGLGFRDCYFYYCNVKQALTFKGERYKHIHNRTFGHAAEFFTKIYSIDITQTKEDSKKPSESDYKLIENSEFLEMLDDENFIYSMDFQDRFFRGHSQSTMDIFNAVYGTFKRIPDIILWPKNTEEVQKIVKFANDCNVALIVFGGGSNVTSSTTCPEHEQRMIAALDTTQMRDFLWINKMSNLASFQCGVSGQELEKILNAKGYTMGHEPDSMEFSTLGGWIATKASGMKQQKYGNIEEIITKMKFVTSSGTFDNKMTSPRNSSGPDFERLMIGSEGTLGVITEAVFKINQLPECKKFGGFLFPNTNSGILFLHEVMESDCLPSNLRLFCNKGVRTGLALEATNNLFKTYLHPIKLFFIKNYLRFDENKFTFAAFTLEGDEENVNFKFNRLKEIAKQLKGYYLGEEAAKHSYDTSSIYSIYLRDFLLDLGVFSDTLETSVIWSKVESCIKNVVYEYEKELEKLNLKGFVLYRISQIYKDGVCLYLYYGIVDCINQVDKVKHMTDFMKEVVLRCGGSLSHHHGIGTKNASRYSAMTPSFKKEMLMHLKEKMDPKNIFCSGNFFTSEKSE